jgi:hypothetical protein
VTADYTPVTGVWQSVTTGTGLKYIAASSGKIKVSLKVGNTYYFEVASKNGSGSQMTLNASWKPVRPANEGYGSAKALKKYGDSIVTDVYYARREASDSRYFPGGYAYHSVWYKWTAPASGTFYMDLGSINYSYYLSVWSRQGCFPGAKQVQQVSSASGQPMEMIRVTKPDAPQSFYFGVARRCTYRIGIGSMYDDVSGGSVLQMGTLFQ